jgi:hypothetical protein
MKHQIKRLNRNVLVLFIALSGLVSTNALAQDNSAFVVEIAKAVALGISQSGLQGDALTQALVETAAAATTHAPGSASAIASAVSSVNPASAVYVSAAVTAAATPVSPTGEATIATVAGTNATTLPTNVSVDSNNKSVILAVYNNIYHEAYLVAANACNGDAACLSTAVSTATTKATTQAQQVAGYGSAAKAMVDQAIALNSKLPTSPN